jgi:hypothetical protein
MALTLRLQRGSDLTLDHERLTIVRKFEVIGTLPYTSGGDAFDFISSLVMAEIRANYPIYNTPMGRLFWNSIQLHERFYAQNYEISVTYSPVNRATGAYQITVDQAVGNVHVTAGRRIAGYDADGATNDPDNGGVMFDGQEVTGTEIPDAEDRITVSYRHPQAFLNHAYIRSVGKLRGFPNKDTFLGYEPGEVRYMGGNYAQTDCEASATYTFDISPNATDLEVGGITIASKTGFDVVSPIYEAQEKNGEAVREVKAIEIIRFREWKDYVPVFGWGG